MNACNAWLNDLVLEDLRCLPGFQELAIGYYGRCHGFRVRWLEEPDGDGMTAVIHFGIEAWFDRWANSTDFVLRQSYDPAGTRHDIRVIYQWLFETISDPNPLAILAPLRIARAEEEVVQLTSTPFVQINRRPKPLFKPGPGPFETYAPPIPDDSDKDLWFLNKYQCPRCDHEWEDEYDSQPDDDCPECGCRHIEPYDSEDLG